MLWQPIEDLSSHWQDLASSELSPLVTVWNEPADRMEAYQICRDAIYRVSTLV